MRRDISYKDLKVLSINIPTEAIRQWQVIMISNGAKPLDWVAVGTLAVRHGFKDLARLILPDYITLMAYWQKILQMRKCAKDLAGGELETI